MLKTSMHSLAFTALLMIFAAALAGCAEKPRPPRQIDNSEQEAIERQSATTDAIIGSTIGGKSQP